jgi:hypothetical protein
VTEGWFLWDQIGNVGPIVDDGTSAWFVNDTVSLFNNPAFTIYMFGPSSAQIAKGETNGWRLSTRLKIIGPDTQVGGSPSISYRNGPRTYELYFGATTNGDPIVKFITQSGTPFPTGPQITLPGAGPGFHDYSLEFDVDEGAASLFIDGTLVMSGFRGWNRPSSIVVWGGVSSGDTGQGLYASVTFEVFEAKKAKLKAKATGLEVSGSVGAFYHLEYSTNFNEWFPFTGLTLPSSPFLVTNLPTAYPNRFFRAVSGP